MSEHSDLHAGRSHARPGLRRPSDVEAHDRPAPDAQAGPQPTPSPAARDRADAGRPDQPSPLMVFVRYVLPALVIVAGLIAMAFGTDVALEGGAGLVGAGLAIWLINWLFRIGVRGDAEREAEDRARDYFDRYGRWPEGR